MGGEADLHLGVVGEHLVEGLQSWCALREQVGTVEGVVHLTQGLGAHAGGEEELYRVLFAERLLGIGAQADELIEVVSATGQQDVLRVGRYREAEGPLAVGRDEPLCPVGASPYDAHRRSSDGLLLAVEDVAGDRRGHLTATELIQVRQATRIIA